MKRLHARLQRGSASNEALDDFLYFFLVCFHLKDWLAHHKEDTSVGEAAEDLINTKDCLRVCADVANGTKHLVLDRYVRIDPNARATAEPFFQAPFVQPGFGQETIVIRAAGEILLAFDVANECVAAWEKLLRDKTLLPPKNEMTP